MRQFRAVFQQIFLPRMSDLLFISIFISVIGIGPGLINIDGDLGRHLTVGKYIIFNQTIPTVDIFSFTRSGMSFTPHEWLAEVAFAAAYLLGQMDGVVVLSALLVAATFSFTFIQSRRRSKTVLISLGITILAAAAASLHWLARPHLFTLLFVPLWVSEMEKIKQGNYSHWWVAPIMMLFWANLHGAFIMGFVIWGIYLVGLLWDSWAGKWASFTPSQATPIEKNNLLYMLLIGGFSFISSLVNPSGLGLWGTSLGYLGNRYLVSHTAEYLPPNFHLASTLPFLLLMVLLIFLLGLKTKKLPTSDTFLLAGWTAFGLYSVRNVPLFSVIAAPIMAEQVSELLSQNKPWQWVIRLDERLEKVDLSLRGWVWGVITVVVVIFAFWRGADLDFAQQGNQFDPLRFPVKAIAWLENNAEPRRMFNYFPWGGYQLYRSWPTWKVFIDGQTDFYGEDLTRQYEQVITLTDGWQDVLNQYQVEGIIMPTQSNLVKFLQSRSEWQQVYQDQTATILFHEP